MIDRKLVVWTRIMSDPVKMGELYTTDRESRFSYEASYIKTNQKGLGLAYPVNVFGVNSIPRPRSEFFDFHPPIQSLLPPKSKRNLIRNLILNYLNKINIHPSPGLETDWEILTKSGHGSIGHLDVFATDQEAEKWYQTKPNNQLVEAKDDFGLSLKEFLTWMDDDAEQLINLLGPTPSLGGAIPKIPLSIPRSGWNGFIGLPTRFGSDPSLMDVIIKFEDNNSYPGIIELEKLGLEIHKMAGFEVPRYWDVEIKGIKSLVIERFDRDENNTPLFMESIYSLLASGNFNITNHYSATYDFIGKTLDNKKITITDNAKESKKHLFKRLVMSLLTGNGDLHLENLSLLEKNGVLDFSPVYDPTPMRAYTRHDMLTPPEMTFGDYGDVIGDSIISLDRAIHRFAAKLKIGKNNVNKILEDCLEVTTDYSNMVSQLKSVPDQNKENLIKIHNKVSNQLNQNL